MKYIECPEVWDGSGIPLFLGGGISGCYEWQWDMVKLLEDCDDLTILNPRRRHYPTNDPALATEQITWEFEHLQIANRMFWFPPETLCPITLFELGKWCASPTPLFVGAHPDYKRRFDLEVQLRLARPYDCKIYDNLPEMAEAIKRRLS